MLKSIVFWNKYLTNFAKYVYILKQLVEIILSKFSCTEIWRHWQLVSTSILKWITYTTEFYFFSGRNDFCNHPSSRQRVIEIPSPVDAISNATRVTKHDSNSTRPLDRSHMGIETLRTEGDSRILSHRIRWAERRLDNHLTGVLSTLYASSWVTDKCKL